MRLKSFPDPRGKGLFYAKSSLAPVHCQISVILAFECNPKNASAKEIAKMAMYYIENEN